MIMLCYMKTICRGSLGAFLAALLVLNVFAEAQRFQDGDRVCFIGDSITHQAMYHTQIQLFYTTRFPNMRLELFNRGFAGDTAAGGVRRYAWDIAPIKPTVATIMLGMNDVERSLYTHGKTGPGIEKQRQKAISSHVANMEKLAGFLARDGVRIIFITPSLYDQTSNQKSENDVGVNDALKACAAAVRKLAVQYKAGLVDFNGPMEAINKAGQAKDPDFTIVPGRVHPGPVGHLVMAYLFLKEQGVGPTVAEIGVDAARRVVTRHGNCEISALSMAEGTLSFTCLEKALPFPVDEENGGALELVPFTEELNQEVLSVTSLPEGVYEVLIDGRAVLKTTAAALGKGVNLATVKETPQYQQAVNVQRCLNERALVEGRKLRTFAHVEHLFLADLKERSPEGDRTFIDKKLAEMRTKNSVWNNYRATVIETWKKLIPEKENLERQSASLLAEISVAHKPVPHLYAIRVIR